MIFLKKPRHKPGINSASGRTTNPARHSRPRLPPKPCPQAPLHLSKINEERLYLIYFLPLAQLHHPTHYSPYILTFTIFLK